MTSPRKQQRFFAALSSRISAVVNSAAQLPVLGILVRAALGDQRHLSKDIAASLSRRASSISSAASACEPKLTATRTTATAVVVCRLARVVGELTRPFHWEELGELEP